VERNRPPQRKAVLLDRDGVLVEDTGYITSEDALRLLPGVPAALAALRDAGFLLVVVSNQSAVARGMISLERLFEIQAALDRLLARRGAALDAAYFCPHHPSEGDPPFRRDCPCRKPRPGLIERAAREWSLDRAACFLVGDSERDFAAAAAAGVRALSVGAAVPGVPRFDGLPAAAEHILASSKGTSA